MEKKLKMLVIPNQAVNVKFITRCGNSLKDRIENHFGIKLEPEDVLIQIRVWDNDGKNYSNHHKEFSNFLGIDVPEEGRKNQDEFYYKWAIGPSYIPYKLIKDMKTGETKKFTTSLGQEFELEANQGRYIHGDWDNTFEKARDAAYECGVEYQFS